MSKIYLANATSKTKKELVKGVDTARERERAKSVCGCGDIKKGRECAKRTGRRERERGEKRERGKYIYPAAAPRGRVVAFCTAQTQ